MPTPPERVATITDAQAVAAVHRLRRILLALEGTLWAAFAAALLLPGEVIPSGVLVVGLAGLGLLELRRDALRDLRARLGRNRLVLDPAHRWLRLTQQQRWPGAWSYDLNARDFPPAVLVVPAVAGAAALAAGGNNHLVPLAVGVGLVHLVAASVLAVRPARHRTLSGLALLGCIAAARQFLRDSTEEQTRAAAGLLLLLVPIGAGWALDRPVWARVMRAPNLRRRFMSLVKGEGAGAAAATLPLLLMLVAVVFAFSRGLVLTVATALAVGAAAAWRRKAPAVIAALAALGVVGVLSPPRDAPTLALVVIALAAGVLGVTHAWPRAWVVASLTAGVLHVVAVRPYVTAVFVLAVAIIAAIPKKEAPAAVATGASTEPAGTA